MPINRSFGGRNRGANPHGGRLPPGQSLVDNFPVLTAGPAPRVPDLADWGLTLKVGPKPLRTWSWQEFNALPQTEMVVDIHCVTQWSRYDNRFAGVMVRDLLDVARPKPEAGYVSLTCYDGYTTNLTLEDFAGADVMFAHAWEGAPLARQHGGPVRLVLPKLYFWKSPKWVTRVELLAEDRPGFWEVRGYHNRGDPWMEERYG